MPSNDRVKPEPGDGSVLPKTHTVTVVRMNPAQAKIIHAAYALQESPTQKQIEELSTQTGLTVKWLKSWYQRTRASKRKKESLLSSAKISNFKSEYKDRALHPHENTNLSPIQVDSTPPLKQFHPSAMQRPPSLLSRPPLKFQQNYERHVNPQPNIDHSALQQDSLPCTSSASFFPEPPLHNDPPLTHTSNNLPRQCPPDIYFAHPDPLILLSSLATRFSSNKQQQYIPAHSEVPVSEPLKLGSSRHQPYAAFGGQSSTLPNIPNSAEHIYNHYAGTGMNSSVKRPNLPSAPSYAQLYPNNNSVARDSDNNDDLPHEAVTPTLQAYSFPNSDLTSLATQLPPNPFSEYRPLVNAEYYKTSSARLTPCNLSRITYEDTAQKAREIVLRSLDEGLVERDSFQAAMGLVVLSRLGLRWD